MGEYEQNLSLNLGHLRRQRRIRVGNYGGARRHQRNKNGVDAEAKMASTQHREKRRRKINFGGIWVDSQARRRRRRHLYCNLVNIGSRSLHQQSSHLISDVGSNNGGYISVRRHRRQRGDAATISRTPRTNKGGKEKDGRDGDRVDVTTLTTPAMATRM